MGIGYSGNALLQFLAERNGEQTHLLEGYHADCICAQGTLPAGGISFGLGE